MSKAIVLKTPEEIELMREAGRLAAQALDSLTDAVKPGVTTDQLNDQCHRYMVDELGVIPAPLNYRGFPKSICTSVNYQVCHGIPGPYVLKNGDILNIDVTVITKDGFHGDTSRMFAVGNKISILAKRLCRISYEAMHLGIEAARPGARLGDVGHVIQSHIERHGFSTVREYCGHGIGRTFHEYPNILHYGKPGTGLEIVPGMTFTIEPMVNAGAKETRLLSDGWTVVTKDRQWSAQWEHTIAIMPHGPEILTVHRPLPDVFDERL